VIRLADHIDVVHRRSLREGNGGCSLIRAHDLLPKRVGLWATPPASWRSRGGTDLEPRIYINWTTEGSTSAFRAGRRNAGIGLRRSRRFESSFRDAERDSIHTKAYSPALFSMGYTSVWLRSNNH
jgi:hypothetical protein